MEEQTNQREAYRRSAIYDLIYYERISRPKIKVLRSERPPVTSLKRKRVV